MTPTQHKLALAMVAKPWGDLQSWAGMLACNVQNVQTTLKNMIRLGYVKRHIRSSKSSRYELLPTVGQCQCCGKPVVRVGVTRKKGNGRLNPAQIAEIRRSRESCRKVAARFGVTHNHVSRIRRGVCWPKEVRP